MTDALFNSLADDGFDPREFAEYFAEWKALGPDGEFSDPYFGKDGAYARPLRSGKRVLRHVHLPPERDPAAMRRWNAQAARCGRKTSDTALIYATDGRQYLLIYIAREPKGHAIADMSTPESRALMESLADIAEAFIEHPDAFIR